MQLEVRKPYNPFLNGENNHARIINIWGDTFNIDILIGKIIDNHSHLSHGSISCTTNVLYQSTMVIGVDRSGQLTLFKNRLGGVFDVGEIVVRQTVFDSFISSGFNLRETMEILSVINQCITQLTYVPIVYTTRYPHGISFLKYQMDGSLVKINDLKKHSFI